MIVLDACAALDWFLQTPAGRSIEKRIFSGRESLHAPGFIDLDIVRALWRLENTGKFPIHAWIRRSKIGWMSASRAIPKTSSCPRSGNTGTTIPREAAYLILAKKLRAAVLKRDRVLKGGYGSVMGIKVELF